MSDEKTPGQVAYEARITREAEHLGLNPDIDYRAWGELRPDERESEEAGAQAVLDSRTPWGDANIVSIEQHRWYAIVRSGGPDGDVVKVIGYRGDSGISCYDSLAEWEAANE